MNKKHAKLEKSINYEPNPTLKNSVLFNKEGYGIVKRK